MSKPIGTGSRFRFLTGDMRGREGAVTGPDLDPARAGWWLLKVDGLGEGPWPIDMLEGSMFQRLADAPAGVDPLSGELAALEAARSQDAGGPDADDSQRADAWLRLVNDQMDIADATVGDPDAGGDVTYRAAMMRAAVLCLAAVRCVDRTHKETS